MKSTNKIFAIALCVVFGVVSCQTKKAPISKVSVQDTRKTEQVMLPDPVPQEEEVVYTSEKVFDEKEALSARNEYVKLTDSNQNSGLQLKKYNIVVGSFGNNANAERLQLSLNEEGYKALIAMNENDMHRVIAISTDDYGTAREKIQNIRKRFSDAWLLILQEK